MRKSKDKRGKVNLNVVRRLEELDVPLLLEIIRTQDKAIRKIMDKAEEGIILIERDAEEMLTIATRAHASVEELAYSGELMEVSDWEGSSDYEMNFNEDI